MLSASIRGSNFPECKVKQDQSRIDYQVVRMSMPGRFPGNYVESASKMEIAALNITITQLKSDLPIIGSVDHRNPEVATEI
jgi:hypothetical protein